MGHDTHGLSWAGRDLTASPFGADSGAADPQLRAALAAGDEAAALTALAQTRVLVPIVAHADDIDAGDDTGDTGDTVIDTHTDMVGVVLTAPDGRRALPVFSGLAALTAWDAGARPVPVRASDAARAAIEDRCDVMLLDLGAPHATVLRSSQMWALAQERTWHAPHIDPIVRDAVAGAASRLEQVSGVDLGDGGQGVLALTLTLVPGLTREEVTAVVERLGGGISADPEARIRIDGLAVTLRGDADRGPDQGGVEPTSA